MKGIHNCVTDIDILQQVGKETADQRSKAGTLLKKNVVKQKVGMKIVIETKKEGNIEIMFMEMFEMQIVQKSENAVIVKRKIGRQFDY